MSRYRGARYKPKGKKGNPATSSVAGFFFVWGLVIRTEEKISEQKTLRISLIAAATLQLAVALAVAILAASHWRQSADFEPEKFSPNPQLLADKLVADVKSNIAIYDRIEAKTAPEVEPEPTDPNQALNERTANAVEHFITTYGIDGETFDRASFLAAIRNQAQVWGDPKAPDDYSLGLTLVTEGALTDPRLIQLMQETVPADKAAKGAAEQTVKHRYRESRSQVVSNLYESYSQQFGEALTGRPALKAKAEHDAAMAKVTALTQVCIACSALCAALMLVLIAVALRLP